jgi:hypothetical protein
MTSKEVLAKYSLKLYKDYSKSSESTHYRIEQNDKLIQKFEMGEMHGCCGIATSFHAYMDKDLKNQGWGTICDLIRQLIAKEGGYSILICTLLQTNEANVKIKEKNGWIKLLQFNNNRTGNEVIMGVFDLNGSLIKTTDWQTEDESIRFISERSPIFKKFQKATVENSTRLIERYIENTLNEMTWFQRFIVKLFKIKI